MYATIYSMNSPQTQTFNILNVVDFIFFQVTQYTTGKKLKIKKNIYVFEETGAASLIWRALRQSNYTLALPNLQFIQYIKN